MNHMTHILGSAEINIFSPKISKCCFIKKYRCRFHFYKWCLILLNFFESSKIILINMVIILMMSAKMATLDLLKLKLLWNNDYDIITPVHDVTNKILSRDSNCIVDVGMWPKFCYSSISMKEVIITTIL